MRKQAAVFSFKFLAFSFLLLAVLSAGVSVYALRNKKPVIEQYSFAGRPVRIQPDYAGTVIPPNIAPLNFIVKEDGSHYYVKIYSEKGEQIEVFSRSPKIIIPQRPWHELLNANRAGQLYFDIFVKTQNGEWMLFPTITNRIAREAIDSFLVYRKLRPAYNMTRENAIYQRNLENYDESIVLSNWSFYQGKACINCHTFCANKTNNMLIHFRNTLTGKKSMLLIEDGKVSDVDSRTQFGSAPMGHSAWHPSGKLIVFTIYKIQQFFHTARQATREGMDIDSAMGYYLLESKAVKTSPKISQKKRLETYPAWSPDGRYLYFCSAAMLWTDPNAYLPRRYEQVKYDLLRVSYDIESDTWGEPETVLSAKQTNQSALLPRISPDGRWLLFCMCEYSAWPGFQASSDLYIIDLLAAQKTGKYEYRRLEKVNSDQADYWHCWSSNSRWFVFSSKRADGILTKVYISYFDENAIAHKPFVLVQKDPAFYDSFIKIYQLPELITEPIPVTAEGLARILRSPFDTLSQIPVTSATPKAETALKSQRWQRDRE